MSCDLSGSVRGTRWLPAAPVTVAPGPPPTTPTGRVQATNPCLILALWARALAPVWTSGVLRVAHVIKGDQKLQKDGQAMPADVLWDEGGIRYLPDPIPMRSDEYVDVYVTNDDVVPRVVSVGAEVVELTSAELDKFKEDPIFRAALLEQLRQARRR